VFKIKVLVISIFCFSGVSAKLLTQSQYDETLSKMLSFKINQYSRLITPQCTGVLENQSQNIVSELLDTRVNTKKYLPELIAEKIMDKVLSSSKAIGALRGQFESSNNHALVKETAEQKSSRQVKPENGLDEYSKITDKIILDVVSNLKVNSNWSCKVDNDVLHIILRNVSDIHAGSMICTDLTNKKDFMFFSVHYGRNWETKKEEISVQQRVVNYSNSKVVFNHGKQAIIESGMSSIVEWYEDDIEREKWVGDVRTSPYNIYNEYLESTYVDEDSLILFDNKVASDNRSNPSQFYFSVHASMSSYNETINASVGSRTYKSSARRQGLLDYLMPQSCYLVSDKSKLSPIDFNVREHTLFLDDERDNQSLWAGVYLNFRSPLKLDADAIFSKNKLILKERNFIFDKRLKANWFYTSNRVGDRDNQTYTKSATLYFKNGKFLGSYYLTSLDVKLTPDFKMAYKKQVEFRNQLKESKLNHCWIRVPVVVGSTGINVRGSYSIDKFDDRNSFISTSINNSPRDYKVASPILSAQKKLPNGDYENRILLRPKWQREVDLLPFYTMGCNSYTDDAKDTTFTYGDIENHFGNRISFSLLPDRVQLEEAVMP
jgi:hypothetical protein